MTTTDSTRFMLRLPPDLKAFIEMEARQNGSSQNSEVIRAVRERMVRVIAPHEAKDRPEAATSDRSDTNPQLPARNNEDGKRHE